MPEATMNTIQTAPEITTADAVINVRGRAGETVPVEEKIFTQEEVNEIVAERLARAAEKQKEEAKKQIEEAQKLAEMNEAEKASYKIAELERQVEEYEQREAISVMTKTARRILSDAGINAPDEILAVLVTSDAEKTKAAVDAFAALFAASLDAEIKSRFKGTPPKSGSPATLTKEQILAEPDTVKRQKLIQENIQLFK